MDLLPIMQWATIVVTFIVLASGLPACIEMYKTKSTKHVPYPLFLVYAFVNVLSLQYGLHMNNIVLILLGSLSILVFGTYISIYLMVSKSKTAPFSMLTGMMAVYLAHSYYLTILPEEHHAPTIGFYMLIWCTILSLVPILDVIQMLREQSSESCDMTILVATTINVFTWFFYGRLVRDVNIWVPNVPGIILCAIKFFMVWYFHAAAKSVVHPVKEKEAKAGFMGHDFHKEVYNVRSRKPLSK